MLIALRNLTRTGFRVGDTLVPGNGAVVRVDASDPTARRDLARHTHRYTQIPWVEITQAAYDALGTPNPNILYIIVG